MRRNRTLILILAIAALAVSGCSRPPGRTSGVSTDPARSDAKRQHEAIVALAASGDWVSVREAGDEFLQRHSDAPQADHVMALVAQAASEQGDAAGARLAYERLVTAYPDGEHAPTAWWELARFYEGRSRWFDATNAYAEYYEVSGEDSRRDEAALRLKDIIDTKLRDEQIERLAREQGDTILGSYVHFLRAQRSYDAGRDVGVTGAMLESFLQDYPESKYGNEARRLLADLREQGYEVSDGFRLAAQARLGLLCPLTGEYAAMGQAMYDGALLALEEHSRATGQEIELISMDTRGDGVRAVQFARQLIENEDALALVGALLSAETIAVATLCSERGVPLISPTATQETISDLGETVFQTNLTKSVETRLVARAAVQTLLKRRLAILHPETEEGRTAADLFESEALQRGGQIVAKIAFDRDVNDFATIAAQLRAAGPEALFVPASPTEMRLIAPQLTFYGVETQLLGPSSWNNTLLTREVGEFLDRALFPSDIALIPPSDRDRFEDLWRRRFPQVSSNPFGLKTYFAVKAVLDAYDQGARSREEMLTALAMHIDGGGGALGLDKLRMVQGTGIEPFPYTAFPNVYVAEPADDESID